MFRASDWKHYQEVNRHFANAVLEEVETGKALRSFKVATIHKYDTGFMADYGGPYCMQFAKDGKQFVAGGITNVSNAFAGFGNPAFCMVDWESGKEVVAHLTKANLQGKAFGVVLHPENFVIGAVGGASLSTLVLVKLGILVTYIPLMILYTRKNWPRSFDPAAIPPDLIPDSGKN